MIRLKRERNWKICRDNLWRRGSTGSVLWEGSILFSLKKSWNMICTLIGKYTIEAYGKTLIKLYTKLAWNPITVLFQSYLKMYFMRKTTEGVSLTGEENMVFRCIQCLDHVQEIFLLFTVKCCFFWIFFFPSKNKLHMF